MNKPKEVFLFSNGSMAITDEDGKTIPELSESWALLVADFLANRGIDPATVKLNFPNDRTGYFFRPYSGGEWNWGFQGFGI